MSAIRNLLFLVQKKLTRSFRSAVTASTVYLSGDFNDWSRNGYPMKKEGDEWVLSVHLFPGKHLYKFVVDGTWIKDPANQLWEQNEHGTGNSLMWFGQ